MSNNLNLDSTAGSNDLDLSFVLSAFDVSLGLAELVGIVPTADYEVLLGRIDTSLGLSELVGVVPTADYEVLLGRIDTALGLSELVGSGATATSTVLLGRIDSSLGLAELVGIVPSVDWTDRHFAPGLVWGLGYDSDGTNITMPISVLSGLSTAEADTVTGDWREILQSLFNSSLAYSKVYIDTPLSEQLDTYKIFKKDLYGRTIDSYFTVNFLTDMGAPNVAPEP